MDVSGGRDSEGQNVGVWRRHNKINQRWKIIYTDKAEKEQTKGLDKSGFGFEVNRPFYIRSKMPMARVIEVVGGRNLVIRNIDPNHKRKEQQWTFDGTSNTIKSVRYPDRSFDIQSGGRSNNLQIWRTSARWF